MIRIHLKLEFPPPHNLPPLDAGRGVSELFRSHKRATLVSYLQPIIFMIIFLISASRASRSLKREAKSYRISSASSSSPDVQGPPPTPRPVLKPDTAETPGKGYRVDELLKESSPGLGKRKRGVPKTPSPASSVDRCCTPEPQRLRQLQTPSPVLNPPPTPAMPRVSSPMTVGGNSVKPEPCTPAAWINSAQSQGSSSDKKLVVYDPKVGEKRMQQAQQSQKQLAISMWENNNVSDPLTEFITCWFFSILWLLIIVIIVVISRLVE